MNKNMQEISNGVAVSICSKDALERLLDGNEEVRIGVRDSILKKFVDNNIRPRMDQESREYFGEVLKKELRKEIRAMFRDENTKSLIKEMIVCEYEKVTKEILGRLVEDRIKELINSKINKIKL